MTVRTPTLNITVPTPGIYVPANYPRTARRLITGVHVYAQQTQVSYRSPPGVGKPKRIKLAEWFMWVKKSDAVLDVGAVLVKRRVARRDGEPQPPALSPGANPAVAASLATPTSAHHPPIISSTRSAA
jgi:hypothetical protein